MAGGYIGPENVNETFYQLLVDISARQRALIHWTINEQAKRTGEDRGALLELFQKMAEIYGADLKDNLFQDFGSIENDLPDGVKTKK